MISPIRTITASTFRSSARSAFKISERNYLLRASSCNRPVEQFKLNSRDFSPLHHFNAKCARKACFYTSTVPRILRAKNYTFEGSRCLSTTSARRDDKVEKTLKLLKDELEITERQSKIQQEAQMSAAELKKRPLRERITNELKHYYHGFRLFFVDTRVSIRLLWQVAKGNQLSRQEKRQLVRTAADLFRLVPFLVFVIVPFMEFLLPFYLKFFPGALPSTFQERSAEEEKQRKHLKVRLEMAKFLNETLEELSLERKSKDENAESKVADFSHFLKRIREGGDYVSNTELLKYSKLFEDELTLDNLSVAQLRALCRIVAISPIGTANILRFHLGMKLRELKADDKLIAKEGVDALSIWELQAACRARGMRAVGLSEERLKSQLNQWLELSMNEKVPPSLLLLSSTLYLPEDISFADRLKTILSTLPAHTADEIKLKLTEMEGGKVDNKAKLEIIKSIEASLKQQRDEAEQTKALQAEKEKLKEEQEKYLVEQAAAEAARAAKSAAPVIFSSDELLDKTPIIVDKAKPLEAKKEEKIIDVEHLDEVEDLLLKTTKDEFHEEKEELKELKQDIKEHKEDLKQVQTLVIMKGEQMKPTKAAERLESTVKRMISKMDNVIEKLQSKKADLKVEMAETEKKEDLKKDIVTINELMLSVRRLQKIPDDTKYQQVVDVLNALDEDKDGAIDVNLALKVIDLIGQENVKISSEKMGEIFELLKKEDLAGIVADDARKHAAKQDVSEQHLGESAKSNNPKQQNAESNPKGAAKEEKSREKIAQ